MGQLFNALINALGAVLAFFYQFLHSFMNDGLAYGLSIILLTIFINILVFPLTLKQTRATRAFTALQPEIKRIQAQYKDDPQEMQRQLMAAQKAAGATPGGCLLPLLVQMPIWFALFRLLRDPLAHIGSNTALAEALSSGQNMSFLGMDLGTSPAMAVSESGFLGALPYLITIVIMVATQYIQQWHATYGQVKDRTQPGAGAQQAVTKVMPLFIGFISWNFPAGLVLYWTTSNLFRLGQQVLIFKIDGRPPVPGSNKAGEPEKKSIASSEDASENGSKKPQQGAADKRRRRRRR
jgi:YidC/Oxa1 family membrane protein insertase